MINGTKNELKRAALKTAIVKCQRVCGDDMVCHIIANYTTPEYMYNYDFIKLPMAQQLIDDLNGWAETAPRGE